MLILLAGLLAAVVTASGCGVATQADVQVAEARVSALESSVGRQQAEIAALQDRIDAIESRGAEQGAVTNNAPESGSPWVIWMKETPLGGNVMIGYKPDTPLGAFATRSECLDIAAKHVAKQEDGDASTLTYYEPRGNYTIQYRLACLPNGVDPRIKR